MLDLRGFAFGDPPPGAMTTGRRPSPAASDWSLQLQCAWRLDGPDGIVTGRDDYHEPEPELSGDDFMDWDQNRGPNLQDVRIAAWLGVPYTGHRAAPPPERRPKVVAVRATTMGGAEIELKGGFRLHLFTAGSRSSDWSLFRPWSKRQHFHVQGNTIRELSFVEDWPEVNGPLHH